MVRRVCLLVRSFVKLVEISRKVQVRFLNEIWHKCSSCVPNVNVRSRSKFKVVCFLHDPSATAMTKSRQVRARSIEVYQVI